MAALLLAGCTAGRTIRTAGNLATASPRDIYATADAPVFKICGALINSPASGSKVPWFRDATMPDADRPVLVRASRSLDYGGTPWVLVSHDCARGVTVSIRPLGQVVIADAVYGPSHGVVAVRLQGLSVGTVTLTASSSGKVTLRQLVDVTAG